MNLVHDLLNLGRLISLLQSFEAGFSCDFSVMGQHQSTFNLYWKALFYEPNQIVDSSETYLRYEERCPRKECMSDYIV